MPERTIHDKVKIGWETLFIAGLLILMFIPFLGVNLFTTKGEPREAIVAVSMLQQDNWILPVSFGADIPYKPPMLAWCVAALGWLNGGVVTEFLSRLPSAIALIAMLVCVFRFFAHRTTVNLAAAVVMITATSLEMFRAATVCRVDMLLTMFVVTALLALYRQWERHPEGTWAPSLVAVLLMSGGVLTKGPVGILLPAMVVWAFRLTSGNRFWQTTVSVALTSLLALILPALWYVAAYQQGGEEFLRLAMEENFGRFTGTMSYESHENPVWYNFVCLAWGLAPYILLLLMAAFSVSWRRCRFRFRGCYGRFKAMDAVERFSLLAAVLIFVFYCIPKSKRSVYLLPVYPFMIYFIALSVRSLVRNGKRCVKAYCWIICVVGVLVAVAVWGLTDNWFPADNEQVRIISEYLQTGPHRFFRSFVFFLTIVSGCSLARALFRHKTWNCFGWTMLYTMMVYCLLQLTVLPATMNYRSERYAAVQLERYINAGHTIYSYKADRFARFYEINFYLNDRLRLFEKADVTHGYVIVSEKDIDSFKRDAAEYTLTNVEDLAYPHAPKGKLIKIFEFSE
jgi:4-amino-4-deoxy-L-arabinose transferase-like glycosyltransferase